MEEQEKIDIREHLIGWIDTFLEDGIVPKVVNPKAIRANYVPKSKIKEKIEELKQERDETYTKFLGGNRTDENLSTRGKMIEGGIEVLQELLEKRK